MKQMGLLKVKGWHVIGLLMLIMFLAGCNSQQSDTDAIDEASSNHDSAEPANKESNKDDKELTKVTHVINWFAQPAHGGQYGAVETGIYEDYGLDVTIEQGGPQVSARQIVTSGKAEFGIANGDEILQARDEGLPIVAVAALYQNSQQAFAFHKGQPIETIEDFNGREVYVSTAAGYWDYLKNEYDLSGVKEMALQGSLLPFIADEESVAQVYATSEPFMLEQEGVEVELINIKDLGYEPYYSVIFVTEQYLEENPETVRAFVEATIDGWNYYYDNYEDINEIIREVNPDLDMEMMSKETEALKEYMVEGDGTTIGILAMTEEKWENLKNILLDIGLIENDMDVNDAFTTEFLPYD